jgi:hypothetical protein
MSIKTGNLGVKYPTAWIQIDQFTLQTAFPDTRTAIIKGTRPALALDGIETGARKLSIQEDTGDIFIRTETGAPLVRITTAGNDAKIGILDGVNTLVLDKLHAIGVHPALALDDKGGFGTTHRIVSKQSELIIQDDFLGIDLVTISSITQDMFVNNGKVGALAGVVVAVQDKFHAIGVSPALRLEGIEAGGRTYRIREDAGEFIISDMTVGKNRVHIDTVGRTGFSVSPPIATIHGVVATDGVNDGYMMDAYGGAPVITGRKARGTKTAPSQTLAGDTLMILSGRGYDGTSFVSDQAMIAFVTEEAVTPTARGCRIDFFTTPIGSQTLKQRMSIRHDSLVDIYGTSPEIQLIPQPVTSDEVISFRRSDGAFIAGIQYLGAQTPGNRIFRILLYDITGVLNDFFIQTRDPAGNIRNRLQISHNAEPANIILGDTAGVLRVVPRVDNTVEIGTDVLRFQRMRAVTITSGKHEFEDKFYIEEDDESLRFHDYKTNELLMKLDKQGNLYIKGSVYKL